MGQVSIYRERVNGRIEYHFNADGRRWFISEQQAVKLARTGEYRIIDV